MYENFFPALRGISTLAISRTSDITDTVMPSALFGLMQKPGYKASLANSRMAQEAALHAVHEQYRLLLAKNAMDDVATISMVQENLSVLVPNAAIRLKVLADIFASSTGSRMERW